MTGVLKESSAKGEDVRQNRLCFSDCTDERQAEEAAMSLPLHLWQGRYANGQSQGSFVWEAVASPPGWGDNLLCFEAGDEGSAVAREFLLL